MNEEISRLPFFINARRLQRERSYFDIDRNEKLRRLLVERRHEIKDASDSEEECNPMEGSYITLEDDNGNTAAEGPGLNDYDLAGVPSTTVVEEWEDEYEDSMDNSQCISMEELDKENIASDRQPHHIEPDEDVMFDKTSSLQLFWMTFKRVATFIGERFRTLRPWKKCADDLESSADQDFIRHEELCNIIAHPPTPTSNPFDAGIVVYDHVNEDPSCSPTSDVKW